MSTRYDKLKKRIESYIEAQETNHRKTRERMEREQKDMSALLLEAYTEREMMYRMQISELKELLRLHRRYDKND